MINLKHTIREEIYKILNEASYNYHIGKSARENGNFQKPYGGGCDNKHNMNNRDTGHFGSGTYFATYEQEGFDKLEAPNEDSPFIQIDDNVYRVDLDFYKNLYRVYSEQQGDVLHSLLHFVNQFYYAKPHYKAILYQKIERSAEYLGLDCPSYRQLLTMAEDLENDNENVESFSTVFMEYNGYNGVNVSGIPLYDNTKFGSVIYDINKTSLEEVTPKFRKNSFTIKGNSSLNTTAHRWGKDSIFDTEMRALEGNMESSYKLNKLPFEKAARLLKNFIFDRNYFHDKRELDKYEVNDLSPKLQKLYLKLLYKSNQSGLDIYKITDAILKNNAYYWLNYLDESHKKSGLISLLDVYYNNELDWDLSDEEISKQMTAYYNTLKPYLKRELSYFEIPLLEDMGVK